MTPTASPSEIAPSEQQCNASNVFVMVVPLVAALLYAVAAPGRGRGAAMCIAIVACAAYGEMGLGIADLTLGHQMTGMLAFYGAVRVAEKPYFLCESRGQLALIVLMIAPNAIIVMTETFHTMHPFMFRNFEWFQHNAFFHKQHALLHFALAMMLGSLATSYWQGDPRLRPSPRVAMARAFVDGVPRLGGQRPLDAPAHRARCIEPDGLVPPPHPPLHRCLHVRGRCHAFRRLRCTSRVADADQRRAGLPPLATPALTMLRLTSTFAYLLLANFLYLVTFFQYLGCRHVLLLADAGGEPVGEFMREGLTIATETSTYLALTFFTSALTLACLVPSGKGGFAPVAVSAEAEQGFLLEPTANGPAAADGKAGAPPTQLDWAAPGIA